MALFELGSFHSLYGDDTIDTHHSAFLRHRERHFFRRFLDHWSSSIIFWGDFFVIFKITGQYLLFFWGQIQDDLTAITSYQRESCLP